MHKNILGTVGIVAGVVLIGYMAYLHFARFDLEITSDDKVYKIDRMTGQTWLLRGDQERPVRGYGVPSEKKSEEEKAIRLVKNSFALGSEKPVKVVIRERLASKRDEMRIIGWRTRKTAPDSYRVRYAWNYDGQEHEFAFTVNLKTGVVQQNESEA